MMEKVVLSAECFQVLKKKSKMNSVIELIRDPIYIDNEINERNSLGKKQKEYKKREK